MSYTAGVPEWFLYTLQLFRLKGLVYYRIVLRRGQGTRAF